MIIFSHAKCELKSFKIWILYTIKFPGNSFVCSCLRTFSLCAERNFNYLLLTEMKFDNTVIKSEVILGSEEKEMWFVLYERMKSHIFDEYVLISCWGWSFAPTRNIFLIWGIAGELRMNHFTIQYLLILLTSRRIIYVSHVHIIVFAWHKIITRSLELFWHF